MLRRARSSASIACATSRPRAAEISAISASACAALDRVGEHVGDRAQEGGVVLVEVVRPLGHRAEDAERARLAVDHHDRHAAGAALALERGDLDLRVGEQVGDDDRLAAGQGAVDDAAGLDRDRGRPRGVGARRQRADQRPLAAGEHLQHADAVDADLAADRVDRVLEQRVELGPLERALAELGDRALALLRAGELGDVLGEALQPDRLARVVVDDVAARVEHARAAVAVLHPHPARERAPGGERLHRVRANGVELALVGQLELEDRVRPAAVRRVAAQEVEQLGRVGRRRPGPPSTSTSRRRPSAGRPRARPRSRAAPPGRGGGR